MKATADLFDEFGDELQSLPLQLRNFGAHPKFSGPIRTVRCFEDNALAKSILSTAGDGAVLVIDGAGSLRTALMGDMIADLAVANGWAGVVIHGAIRDSVALSTTALGIKALGSNPRKSAKTGAGVEGAELHFGDVTFRPGAVLYSDEDGILVER